MIRKNSAEDLRGRRAFLQLKLKLSVIPTGSLYFHCCVLCGLHRVKPKQASFPLTGTICLVIWGIFCSPCCTSSLAAFCSCGLLKGEPSNAVIVQIMIQIPYIFLSSVSLISLELYSNVLDITSVFRSPCISSIPYRLSQNSRYYENSTWQNHF